MIFYYVENSKVHIADLDNKHNLIIDNNDDLDQYINRKGSEIWITYDQADYFKKVVTVYDCKYTCAREGRFYLKIISTILNIYRL